MEQKKELCLYDSNRMIDILAPVASALQKGDWYMKGGLIYYATISPVYSGWNQTIPCPDRDCIRWLHIFFNAYNIVPKPCFGCFKIVTMPQTVKDLMRVKTVQERMGLPAKCGIEERGYVERNYGGYWYAPLGKGLKVARRLLNEVKKQLVFEFGEEAAPHTILKRGCTEMERSWGPSHEWGYDVRLEMLYELLEAGYAKIPVDHKDPSMKMPHTLNRWIEFAASIGDMTYKEFKPVLHPSPVDYTFENHGVEEEEIVVIGGDDE